MYPYQANGEGELNVDEGQEIVILEPDGKYPFAFNLLNVPSCTLFFSALCNF
jgi:hypothetical protein